MDLQPASLDKTAPGSETLSQKISWIAVEDGTSYGFDRLRVHKSECTYTHPTHKD